MHCPGPCGSWSYGSALTPCLGAAAAAMHTPSAWCPTRNDHAPSAQPAGSSGCCEYYLGGLETEHEQHSIDHVGLAAAIGPHHRCEVLHHGGWRSDTAAANGQLPDRCVTAAMELLSTEVARPGHEQDWHLVKRPDSLRAGIGLEVVQHHPLYHQAPLRWRPCVLIRLHEVCHPRPRPELCCGQTAAPGAAAPPVTQLHA